MKRLHRAVCIAVSLCLLTATFAFAQDAVKTKAENNGKAEAKTEAKADAKEKEEGKEKEAPKTLSVKPSKLKAEVELTGVFEAAKVHEVAVEPEEWSAFKVTKAVELGTQVKKGEPIVWFETKDIDKQLQEREHALKLQEIALQQATEELKYYQATYDIDVEAARRAHEQSKDDLKYYFDTEKPMTLKSAELSLKSAEYQLESAQEELKQLEKMYAADDLIEDTEEIILKRAKFSVEIGQFYLENAKQRNDNLLNRQIPRQEVRMKESAEKTDFSYRRTVATMPTGLRQRELEVEKRQTDLEEAKKKLELLQADRELMVVHAPADGIVYYGHPTRGDWPSISNYEKMLRPKGGVMANAVFLSVVETRPLAIHSEFDEKHLRDMRIGLEGTAIPTGYPKQKLQAKITRILPVPIGKGKYDTQLAVTVPDNDTALMPGMTCKIKLTVYQNDQALMVPSSAIFAGEQDTQHVFVVDEKGKHEKVNVTKGRVQKDKTEILQGLKAGDKILLEKPADPEKK